MSGEGLRERVLDFVDEHPGSTSSGIQEGVRGSGPALREALQELAAEGVVENRGTPRRHAWHPAEPAPPRGFGDLLGLGSGPDREELGELGGGLAWAEPGESVAGWLVSAWAAPAAAAELVDVSTRQLRRLEEKGLPAEGGGRGREKRYPLPHLLHWLAIYGAYVDQDRKVESLPYDVAALRIAELEILAFGPEEFRVV